MPVLTGCTGSIPVLSAKFKLNNLNKGALHATANRVKKQEMTMEANVLTEAGPKSILLSLVFFTNGIEEVVQNADRACWECGTVAIKTNAAKNLHASDSRTVHFSSLNGLGDAVRKLFKKAGITAIPKI